jgi:hypothetical protein
MTGAIVFSWGGVVAGREAKSLEVFGKVLAYMEELHKSGRIHGHREYFSVTGNQSKWAGMMIVDGDFEELLKLPLDDDYRKILIESSAIVENFTQEFCVGGSDSAIQESIGNFTEAIGGLGYM